MRNIEISLCYHPTTVGLIDDNVDYLHHLLANLNEEYPCLPYANPLPALDYFENAYRYTSFASHCVKKIEEDKPRHLTSAINIEMIQQEIFRRDRFSEVAVVVIDYNMPALNGIEVSKRIKQKGIMTILLTGEAENELAISALNHGHIDYFVKKTEEASKALLLAEVIQQLQKKFFLKQSAQLLSKMPESILACLSDREVAATFDEICEKNRIIEFYLLNEMGNFLMVDKAGNPSYFVLASEQDLDVYYNTANIEDAPQSVLESLKNRNKVLFFHTEQDLIDTSPTEWEKYLQDATKIAGKQNYYYALVHDTKRYPIKKVGEILSYSDYLSSLT